MDDIKDKKAYELALLIKSEEELAPILTLLKQHGGELTSEPRAKKLALAYKIKGHTEAVFVTCNFTALPSAAKELEHDLTPRASPIRFMIVIAGPQSAPRSSEGPSAFPAQRRGRPIGARSSAPSMSGSMDSKPAAPRSLSNEALEKKIEEILQ